MTRAELKSLTASVQELYARAAAAQPPRACQGRTQCCRFRLAGHVPYVTRAEAWVAAAGVRASGKTSLATEPPGKAAGKVSRGKTGRGHAPGGKAGRGKNSVETPAAADGACPCLGPDGRCTIYVHRPLGCRTHFCDAAGGPVPRAAVQEVIRALETLDRQLGGDGSRQLPGALAAALRDFPRR